MCVVAVAWQVHPRWPLVVIGNRDEFHARAATAAEFQHDAPEVYGGRDLEQHGSWLQVSSRRRLAVVTNVRQAPAPQPAPRSRGKLVADFVRSAQNTTPWFDALADHAVDYGRFHLLAWDGSELALGGNHPSYSWHRVAPGVHGLSNGPLDAPWPKLKRARAALSRWIDDDADRHMPDFAPLFEALADERVAPDDQLPDTGIGLPLERTLSPPFVRGDRYGTRCSSIVLFGRDVLLFAERRFGPRGAVLGEHLERIAL